MRKKCYGRKVTAVLLAGAMAAGLTACGGAQGGEPAQEEVTAPEAAQEETAESDGTGTEEGADAESSAAGASGYSVTEENGNRELTMNRQPEASYWFPEQLLAWNADEDEDLRFNVSTVPLAKRVDIADLKTVNGTQNKDTRSMAISIMNGSTSGNSPHGLNKAEVNAFSYWQYVDLLVYWGGSSGEGLIVAPSADVVDAGHKNGVPVIGTVFMPQAAHVVEVEAEEEESSSAFRRLEAARAEIWQYLPKDFDSDKELEEARAERYGDID